MFEFFSFKYVPTPEKCTSFLIHCLRKVHSGNLDSITTFQLLGRRRKAKLDCNKKADHNLSPMIHRRRKRRTCQSTSCSRCKRHRIDSTSCRKQQKTTTVSTLNLPNPDQMLPTEHNAHTFPAKFRALLFLCAPDGSLCCQTGSSKLHWTSFPQTFEPA